MSDSNFNTGAVRSADANGLDFMSISPIAMIALARTCQEGGTKYGYHNWELGMDTVDILNHVHRHLQMWQAGDRTEPHLAHALWGVHAAVHMDTLHPELSVARRRGPACSVTPEMRGHLEANKAGLAEKRKAGVFARLGEWTMAGLAEIAQILGQRQPATPAGEPSQATYRGTKLEMLRQAFHENGITDQSIYGDDAAPKPRGLDLYLEEEDEDDRLYNPPAGEKPVDASTVIIGTAPAKAGIGIDIAELFEIGDVD